MPTTYIIGHQKPDTDAVVAAMALAELHENTPTQPDHANSVPVIADPLNPETTFLFEKFGVTAPRQITAADITAEDKVILVDHNEESQRMTGINPDQIVNIVDHHKANINFNAPICLVFRPWGSTSTIMYHMMKTKNVTPSKTIAALMLAAILSDTVGFKSATTTPKDKEYGEELAKIAEISDVEAFTLEIFKAKSDVSALSDEEIVKNDFKVFEFGKKTMIDQLETVEQDMILTEKKASLLAAMQSVKAELGVELLFVAITDILKVNTKLLILGNAEAQVAQDAFGGTVTDNILDIGPKMSRKKEIAPAIEKALA
ncbi:MAG: manganese-dependent inorganic pyrophosphatase [Pseudomonadales bacterium]|nr:manganese-dependent inorganic pyrophosphatase [Candidatus Woesebacteria bacterium]MCB9801147.1 manganese-dependent inorganic pyrophosphatase [Pseudomonadales bacterium]